MAPLQPGLGPRNGNGDIVQEATKLIERGGLPHPLPMLLGCFVQQALDPRVAAQFVLRNCPSPDDQQALRSDLLALVSDWRQIVEAVLSYGSQPPLPDPRAESEIWARDGGRCSITGKVGTAKDPLIVAPILPIPSRWAELDAPRTSSMLGAFFGPQYRDWWLGYCRLPVAMDPRCSHWLVRRSAADYFAQGLLCLNRLQPSMVEYAVENNYNGWLGKKLEVEGSVALLGDHSRHGIKKVDPRFVGTQYRLSYSIRWLAVADMISDNSQPRAPTPTRSFLSVFRGGARSKPAWPPAGLLKAVFLTAWCLVPARLRVATYKLLQVVGRRLYGAPWDYSQTQRLPFGLYLKFGGDPDMIRNEYNALQELRRHTSIPAPKPLDLATIPTGSRSRGGELVNAGPREEGFLITTRLPGRVLGMMHHMMSDADNAAVIAQIQEYIRQLRSIPKAANPQHAICNTLGGPIRDTRIKDGDPQGPFVDEEAFSNTLRFPDDPARAGHRIVFTHADLNFRNILVDLVPLPDGTRGWRVTGIVDWEMSGFLPEYWEYTKSMYERERYSERTADMYHDIFRGLGDYSKEYDVEVRSWEAGYN